MPRHTQQRRRAATLIEAAIVFGVFLTLVLGMLDLGIALFRQHVLSGACRQGARQAIVHGSLAAALGSWGPATIGPVNGNDSSPLAQGIRPYLAGLDPSTVSITAEWLDGGNEPEQRVRVTVSTSYQPILTSVFGETPLTLQATSTLGIEH